QIRPRVMANVQVAVGIRPGDTNQDLGRVRIGHGESGDSPLEFGRTNPRPAPPTYRDGRGAMASVWLGGRLAARSQISETLSRILGGPFSQTASGISGEAIISQRVSANSGVLLY